MTRLIKPLTLALILATASLKGETPVKNPTVVMKTTMGSITIELDAAKAPETVKNFLAYVNAKHYDGTVFHRVIDGFMIQGGGFAVDKSQKKTNAAIKNESSNGLQNKNGTIAMARTGDPNSATAQFFINVKDNGFLDYRDPSPQGIGYAVFGRVVDGMNTVLRISRVETTTAAGNQNVPQRPIIIESVAVKPGK
jgi:cyclophilin family peptidyl-prolyl cis-trans isomerase